jgi:integrase
MAPAAKPDCTAFKRYLTTPAAAFDRRAAVRELDKLTKDGSPIMATRAGDYLRALYSWARKRGTIDVNPFTGMTTTPTVKREGVLTDDEIRAVWQATDGAGPYNAVVRILLLTGQRGEEVANMTRDEISADGATWALPAMRTKNAREHVVPLSTQARAIIAAQPRLTGAKHVFPTGRADRPVKGFSHPKVALDQASKVQGWRIHDLRRTVATGLQKLGVRLEVTEAVLNHVSGSRAGIVGVYQRHDWADEKKVALQAWADRVQAIVEGRGAEASNVTPLRANSRKGKSA